MANLMPLRVRATLQNSLATVDPWSPALDAILAYWALRERYGDDFFTRTPDPNEQPDLPLERVTTDDVWWWAASSPIVPVIERFTRHEHRRFDLSHAVDRVAERVKIVQVQGGPYKNTRARRTMSVAPYVEWHVIGDQAGIEHLLRRCTAVGGGHTRGNGVVMRWEVTSAGAEERLARFHRPLPEAYARAHGVAGPVREWGVKPPGWHSGNRTMCVMPVAMEAA